MAPEQVAGAEITPRTDIYGLGGILYVLLTGRPPFVGDSTAETLRLISMMEPVAPRLLSPKLPRELELICLKCLEKDPKRRYASAAELADDLNRFLTGRPVSVRPLGPLGQTWKLARRHPVTSSLLTLLALVIALSLVGLHSLYRQAESQRAQAEMARAAAEASQALAEQSLVEQNAIATFLTREIPELARPRPGRPPAEKFTYKEALVQLAERVPERFADQPRVAAKLELSLGVSFRHLGELGHAETYLLRARERFRPLAQSHPADADDIENSLAVLYTAQGRSREALAILEELWAAHQSRYGPEHANTLTSRHNLAMALRESGRNAEALEHLQAVLAAREKVLPEGHLHTLTTASALAAALLQTDAKQAEQLAAQAVQTARRVQGAGSAIHLDALAILVRTLFAQNRYSDAAEPAQQCWDGRTQLLGENHPETLSALSDLARIDFEMGRPDRAEERLRLVLTGQRKLLGQSHSYALKAEYNLGMLLTLAGRHDAALATFRELLPKQESSLGPNHPATNLTRQQIRELESITAPKSGSKP